METAYVQDNAAERERLFTLTRELTESDLRYELSNGWTVSATLFHLAFWDYYYAALVSEWERKTYTAAAINADAVNEALAALSGGIPPEAAARLAREAAEAVDKKAERVDAELAEKIVAAGCRRTLYRHMHRKEHLDTIEQALGGKAT